MLWTVRPPQGGEPKAGSSVAPEPVQANENATDKDYDVLVSAQSRALAEYYRSTGRMLEAEGVELEDPLGVDQHSRFGWAVEPGE